MSQSGICSLLAAISDVTSQNYAHVFYMNACRSKNEHENWNSVNTEVTVKTRKHCRNTYGATKRVRKACVRGRPAGVWVQKVGKRKTLIKSLLNVAVSKRPLPVLIRCHGTEDGLCVCMYKIITQQNVK